MRVQVTEVGDNDALKLQLAKSAVEAVKLDLRMAQGCTRFDWIGENRPEYRTDSCQVNLPL